MYCLLMTLLLPYFAFRFFQDLVLDGLSLLYFESVVFLSRMIPFPHQVWYALAVTKISCFVIVNNVSESI